MEPHPRSPVRWAETVTAEEFTGLRQIEDRVLAAGVPGGPHEPARRLGAGGVVLVILGLVIPVAGAAIFLQRAAFVQDGVVRILGSDLDPDLRLSIGAACFGVASLEALALLALGARRRGRESVPVGLPMGIGVLAALALVQIVAGRSTYLPGGFDARLVPIVLALVLALAAAAVGLFATGPGVPPPKDPVGPPVSRDAISALSLGDLNALLDSRSYVLLTLRSRGIVDHNVVVADLGRRPLGSWE